MPELVRAAGAGCAPAPPEPSRYEPAAVVRHIARELRQPLSTIESIAFYLDMVLPRTEGRARRRLGELRQEVQQMQWILEDASHFLGAVAPEPELADLSEVVSRNVSDWAAAEGLSLRFEIDLDLPLVRIDVGQVEHLLRNLLRFFRRFGRPSDPILFATSGRGQEVLLEIRSTACAGAPEQIGALFEPFERHFPAGTGLALASVRSIADAHGAGLEFQPEAAGGCRLTIAFPAAD